MKDVNFALVGCGRVANKHVDAITATEHARIVAVCDTDLSRATAVAAKVDARAFSDLDTMLTSIPSIDVVNVLTPTGYHAEHVIRVASHGKHVVVEKPMSLRLDDADQMILACDRAGVRLFVVKPLRYNAPVQQLRRALDEGRFGKLVMGTVRVRWSRRQDYYDSEPWRGTCELDGGVLANQASHHVDLLLWMLGQVESVYAKTATQLVDIETEDTAAVVLQFASGALGIIEATTATRPVDLEGSLSILGERGSVVIAGYSVDRVDAWKFEPSVSEDESMLSAPGSRGRTSGHRAFIADVVRSVHGKGAALVDGLEGRKSIEVINAIYESVRTKREVSLRYGAQRSLSPLASNG